MSGGRVEHTRESILQAALVEMATSATVDMATIAHRAAVDRSTVYRYFGSRERLLRELSDRSVLEIGRRVGGARLDEPPFELALHRFLRALFDVGDRYAVLVREHIAPDEALLARFVRIPLRQLLERGRDEGALRSDIDPEWLFVALWRLIGPWLEYSVDASDPDVAVLNLLEVFLRGAGPLLSPVDQPASERA